MNARTQSSGEGDSDVEVLSFLVLCQEYSPFQAEMFNICHNNAWSSLGKSSNKLSYWQVISSNAHVPKTQNRVKTEVKKELVKWDSASPKESSVPVVNYIVWQVIKFHAVEVTGAN